jgi:omega-6 fatty acid desaturase (delta-12 desaturase)
MTHRPDRAQASPPAPGALVHLRAADPVGWAFAALVATETLVGLSLSWAPFVAAWLVGQLVLAFALVQWFVLLHECGHGTLFATRRWNLVVGHVSGFFSLIPFGVWLRIHARHHRWAGWQDVDPTTAALAPRPLGRLERTIVNVCWRAWIPLFATLYRLSNFWNVPRLLRLFPDRAVRRSLLIGIGLYAALFIAIAVTLGPSTVLRLVGLAGLLAFIAQEVLIVSQHTHVPMTLSQGAAVSPYPALDQEVFTRSLRLPPWLSRLVLHFDAHELHHMYPFVPGYWLDRVPYAPRNEVGWRHWIPAARAVPGEVFFFQNRDGSGFDV